MLTMRQTNSRGFRGGTVLANDDEVSTWIFTHFKFQTRKIPTPNIVAEILDQVNDENPGYDLNPWATIDADTVSAVVDSWISDNPDRLNTLDRVDDSLTEIDMGNDVDGTTPGGGSSGGGLPGGGGTTAGGGGSTGGSSIAPRSQPKAPQSGQLPQWVLPVAAGIGLGLLFVLLSKRASRR